jgi:uncharacterized membrane protein
MTRAFHPLDVVAFAAFLGAWVGYTLYADYWRADRGLMGATARHRIRWMEEMIGRENRIYDSTIVQTIARSPIFFAQTSVFILAGLIALLGAGEQARGVLAEVPMTAATSSAGWHAKIALEIVIFVFAFFKFTWSMRQFNYLSILMGAAPAHGTPALARDGRAIVARAARVSDIATLHFNSGIRAYYFGLAALAWFVRPELLIASSCLVVAVLWRREFRSRTLDALKE